MQKEIYQLKSLRIKLILLLIFISGFGFSQQVSIIQISGVVSNSSDGTPIENQQINILVSDSISRTKNDIFTDLNGYFEDTIHTILNDGMVIVYVYDCENKVSSRIFSFIGNTNLVSNFIVCASPPKNCNAYFTSELDSAYPTINLVHFYDSSSATANIISWNWDFGDGQTSAVQDTQHIYYFPDKYNVCLTIQTADMCTSTYCDSINASNIGPNTCTADFTTQVDTSNPLGYLFFDNSTTQAYIVQYLWDFGDGDSNTTTGVPYHLYSQKGIYEVKLGIVTQDSCVDIHVDTIYVDTIMVNTCQAEFQFVHDTTSLHPYEVNFTDYSITPGSNVISWSWYFDDGTASNMQNPTRQFICAGIYNVRLTILTSDSCSATITKEIIVGNPQKYIIGGQAFNGLYPLLDTGIAYLYKSYGNFIKPVDTMAFGKFGCYYFIDVYEGYYKVKIAPLLSSNYYNSIAPTYYPDELFWNNANDIHLNSFNIALDVQMVEITQLVGQCSISGQVAQGSKSQTENVEILLLDINDNPVKYTYSDNSGHFSFNNLAHGTYYVWAEATGLYTNPVSVTLSQNNCNVNGVTVYLKDSSIFTGVVHYDYNPLSSIGNIYPNPVESNINVEFDIVSSSSFNVSIFDIVGRQILSKEIELGSGFQTVSIPVNYLKAGIYILDIKSKDGSVSKTQKIIK